MNSVEFIYIENGQEVAGLGYPVATRSIENLGGMLDKNQRHSVDGIEYYKVVPLCLVIKLGA